MEMNKKQKITDMTQGPVFPQMARFALPVLFGMLCQRLYNFADTYIVGHFLGDEALAAVGSSYTLMVFLTSILIGLCMGSGVYLSIQFGKKDQNAFQEGCFVSFLLIAAITLVMNVALYFGIDLIMRLMNIPPEVYAMMREYLWVIFAGLFATFLYNYLSNCLRAVGNSVVPLVFLAASAGLNIVLDLWFVLGLQRGTGGAAEATVIAQYVSGTGIAAYTLVKYPQLRPGDGRFQVKPARIREIAGFSILTCVQQSVMNLGILLVQGLVNSFGPTVMAAFAAAVKIDSFAYMPVQDFGNAFSTFIAQNYGAKREDRIRAGLKGAVIASFVFCALVSALVFAFAAPLMGLFTEPGDLETVAEGCAICALRARSTAASAACSCCTGCTGPWAGPVCRWC